MQNNKTMSRISTHGSFTVRIRYVFLSSKMKYVWCAHYLHLLLCFRFFNRLIFLEITPGSAGPHMSSKSKQLWGRLMQDCEIFLQEGYAPPSPN